MRGKKQGFLEANCRTRETPNDGSYYDPGYYQKEINLVNEKFNLEKSYSNGLEKQIKQSKRKHLVASFGVGVVGALTGFLVGVILK